VRPRPEHPPCPSAGSPVSSGSAIGSAWSGGVGVCRISVEGKAGTPRLLEALEVVVFDEDDPCDLVRKLRPDIIVKGSDYSRETMPEVEIVEGYGGRVVIVPKVEGYSTTGIVERMAFSG
jgi:hypothetical protein